RRSLHTGRDKDHGAGRRNHAVAVELKRGAPLQNQVELLVRVRILLFVLVDDPVPRVAPGPRVDPEGRDAEVVPHRSIGTAPVVPLLDLVEARDRVTAHWALSLVVTRREVIQGNAGYASCAAATFARP